MEMYLHHKILKIYDNIEMFISPSKFMINKIKEMGFDRNCVYIPNAIDLTEYQPNFSIKDSFLLYFGRLDVAKGLFTLLQAMKLLPKVELKILGEGPTKDLLKKTIKKERLNNIALVGYKQGSELKKMISDSRFVIVPSECYENNPRSIIEAFALGKPVIASRIGGIPEIVKEGETGLTFEPGDAQDLVAQIKILLASDSKIEGLGRKARKFVEDNFSSEMYYKNLLEVYRKVINRHKND
jgi:glycosyltransferase involved in cell wall biosynthesis